VWREEGVCREQGEVRGWQGREDHAAADRVGCSPLGATRTTTTPSAASSLSELQDAGEAPWTT
jgi:hypothetical protein